MHTRVSRESVPSILCDRLFASTRDRSSRRPWLLFTDLCPSKFSECKGSQHFHPEKFEALVSPLEHRRFDGRHVAEKK